MKRPRLTKAEKQAITTVLDEFLAGHDVEMTADAFGMTKKEAERLLGRLSSANAKLTH